MSSLHQYIHSTFVDRFETPRIGSRSLGLTLAFFFCLLAWPNAASAATCRWTGAAAGDNRWSTATNWADCAGRAPQNGDDVTFQNAGAQGTNVNDIAGLRIATLLMVGQPDQPVNSRWNISGAGVIVTSRVILEELRTDLAGNAPAFLAPITLAATMTIVNQSIVQTPGGGTSSNVRLGDIALAGFTPTFQTDFPISVIGHISGNGGLRKTGTSLLVLNDNSYTGATDILAGSIRAAASTALGADTPLDSTTVETSATLLLADGVTVNEHVLLANGSIAVAANTSATFSGPINVPPSLTPGVPLNGDLNVDGALTVTGSIVASTGDVVFKVGAGTVTLSNPLNVWPQLAIADGTVRAGVADAMSKSGRMSLLVGGAPAATLDLNGFDLTIGSLDGGEGSRILLGSHTLTINQSVPGTYAGIITGTGNIVKSGPANAPATLTLAGLQPNTCTGTTTVLAGRLALQKPAGVAALAGPVVVTGGTLAVPVNDNQIVDSAPVVVNAPGVLDLTDHKEDIGSLSGSGQVLIGKGTLTIGRDNTSTTFTGTLHGDPAPGGQGAEVYFRVLKVGSGTLTLTGESRLADQAVVDAGTLVLDGKINGSAVLVRGGVLGGSGTIFDNNGLNTFVSNLLGRGGAISPGHSPGVIHADQADFAQGSSFIVQINGAAPGTGYDQLSLLFGMTLAPDTKLTVTRKFGAPKGSAFTIIDLVPGAQVNGTFSGLPEGGTVDADGQRFTISYRGGTQNNDVVLTALEDPPPITYFLSEGATGGFFDEDVLIANPNDAAAPVTLTFSKENGQQVKATRSLPPQSHLTVHVDQIAGLEATSASAQVTSESGQPLVVERSMFWDKTYYAGHTGSAVDEPGPDWFFAEGSQGFFDTFVLVINPNPTATDVTFTFFRENEAPVTKTVAVGPTTRLTLHAGDVPELIDRSFGIAVHASQPIMAERSVYFGTTPTRLWSGGTESAGVNAPSTHWFLAEGATGGFFDTFVLLSNPQTTAANVTVQYLLDTGETITVPKTIPANTRLTINIEAEDDVRLHNAAVSTVVTSDVAIIAERSMYWPGAAVPWGEGHNSFGVVDAGTSWGLSEGRIGGPLNFHTYILLANPQTTAANVTVRYLRDTGAPVTKTYTVPPTSRFNIDTSTVAELHDESFGAVITVTNGVNIIVERSMYWDSNGFVFSGGTNATGIRLP
jgi:autotransporter-associated beta strand protein